MGGGGELRVVVMVEDSRFRIACKSGSTIEWLLGEAASRYAAALQRAQGGRGESVRADALLTGDGSFLDPLDLVADVCEPDELLIAVLRASSPPSSAAPAARGPLNVEQMVMRLKTLASDSSTSTDSVFEPDDVLGLSLSPLPPLSAAAASSAALALADARKRVR